MAVSVHLEAKTANLGYVLKQGGAEVYLTGSNPLSTQDDVAAGPGYYQGVETFSSTAWCPGEDLPTEALGYHPTSSSTTGISLSTCWGQNYRIRRLPARGCKETTTGILRLKARERRPACSPCPMVAVNEQGQTLL